MTDSAKKKLRQLSVLVAAALSAVGWGASRAVHGVDTRYVHQTDYTTDRMRLDSALAQHLTRDSAERVSDSLWKASIATKVDSVNLRLTQIKCGPAIVSGCR